MKTLYLTPGCFDKGGTSRYNRYQVAALRELFGEGSVGVMSVLGPDENSFEEAFEYAFAAGGTSSRQKAAFVARATSWALRERPALVCSAHVNLSGLGVALARALGAKSVVNVYGLEVWSRMRRDAAFGLKRADRVLSDCHFTAEYVADQGLHDRQSIDVLWDCVDVSRFHPGEPRREVLERYGIPDPRSGVNLLTLGRLAPTDEYKGYLRLLDVFARVASDCPDLRLIYGGGGPLAHVLRERAASAGLAHRVYFTGFVHERDLPDVYRASHLFSLVSDRGPARGEGVPLTPLEAAACGLPILVGDQDGSQEAIAGGRNGYVVNPFDLDAHARHVRTLYADAAAREAMGRAAHARIVAEHSFEVFRDRLAVHLQALGIRNGGP